MLQIQLAAAHHLQPGQSCHHIRRQVKELRHGIQHPALLSIALHMSHLFATCMRKSPQTCLSHPGMYQRGDA